MENTKKRITWIVIGALFAFSLLFGGSRISVYAQKAVMEDGGGLQSTNQTAQAGQFNLSKQAGEFEVFGAVQALSSDKVVIEGRTFILLPGTEFKAQIQVGDFVKLHVYPLGDGFAVREIERAMPGAMDDNGNQNGDDNGNMNGDDNGNQNGDDNGNQNGDDNGNGDDHNDNGDDDNGNGDDDNGNGDDDKGKSYDD